MVYEEFKRCLTNLKYLYDDKDPRQAFKKHNFNSQSRGSLGYNAIRSSNDQKSGAPSTQQLDQSIELCNQLWFLLNPNCQDYIEKAPVYDLLFLFMFNITTESERAVGALVAEMLVHHYKQLGISLKAQEQEQNQSQSMMSQVSNPTSPKYTPEFQIIDKFLSKRKKSWPLKQLISIFKKEHARRMAYIMHKDATTEKSTERVPEAILSRKTLQGVLPRDSRNYKADSLKRLINNYTFSPRIHPLSEELAAKHYSKLVNAKNSNSRPPV